MEELPQESIEKLARVTKLLRTQRTLPAKLEAVAALASRTVPNCDAAGISLIIEGEPTSCAVSDRLALEIDLVQYQRGQGPCLDPMPAANVVRIDVLERDSRCARLAPGASARDINSVLSTPLCAGGTTIGALNLYSRAENAFDSRAKELAQPLADYAFEVVSSSPLYACLLEIVDGLLESLEGQALIAQATGVIIATEHMTNEGAMDRLRDLALVSGESLRTVAERVLVERPTAPFPAEFEDEAVPEEP